MHFNFQSRTRVLSWILFIALAVMWIPSAGAAQQPTVSSNINRQDYSTYTHTVQSYLIQNVNGGLSRVEYTGNSIVVEDYSNDFSLQSSRTIQMELTTWGGFFAGKDANYFIFGQNNLNESKNTEVIRVVKYSKDWKRLAQTSLKGINTTIPFDSSAVRCAEYGGYLYIHTGHQKFREDDGINHQANMTLQIKESDMTLSDAFYDTWCVDWGYISHSFNQFILVDQEHNIVTLSHCDSRSATMGSNYTPSYVNTRGAVVVRYDVKAGQPKFRNNKQKYCSFSMVQNFVGNDGQNTTGASLGGFAETKSGYISAYNYDGAGKTGPRNVFLGYTSKNGLQSKKVKVSVKPGTSTPALVSTGLNNGYIIWNGKSGAQIDTTLYYASYSDGGAVGAIKTASGSLSDCQPISYNGKVVWYVTNNSAPTFYTLDANGVTSHPVNGAPSETQPNEKPSTSNTQPSNTPATSVTQLAENSVVIGATCAVIDKNHDLWMWGFNYSGQVGSGSTQENVLTPVKVLDNVSSVQIGSSHTAAIRTDGSLWMWGSNYYGQLGNGTETNARKPIKIMDNVASVVATQDRTAAIKKDGSLWVWGDNNDCQLGVGSIVDNMVQPPKVLKPYKLMDDVKSISYSKHGKATGIIKNDNSLWMCGYNQAGVLLSTTKGSSVLGKGDLLQVQPTPAKSLDNVSKINLDSLNLIGVLRPDKTLWTWGYGDRFYDNPNDKVSPPQKVLDTVRDFLLFDGSAAAIREDGSLWMWGSNSHGQLGFQGGDYTENVNKQNVPKKIMDNVIDVKGSYDASFILKSDSTLWACGGTENGFLGIKSLSKTSGPVKIMEDVIAVPYARSAVKKDGTLWLWGSNSHGEIGNGNTQSVYEPVQVKGIVCFLENTQTN